jgi:hypothetical protein
MTTTNQQPANPPAPRACEHCGATQGVTEDRFGNWLCARCAAQVAADEWEN